MVANIILVGAGGAVGAVARYLATGVVIRNFSAGPFPLGTLVVNVTGCFIIGVLTTLAEHHHVLSQEARLLLITGLLGGFTTFSAFGFETVLLLRTGEGMLALMNVLLSVSLSLLAVYCGSQLVPR